MVYSRSFGVINSRLLGFEDVKVLSLVPLADMLNHSNNANVIWGYDNTSHGFKMKATKDIKRGEECFDTYGAHKSNDEFLLIYGYLNHDSGPTQNAATLLLSLIQADP